MRVEACGNEGLTPLGDATGHDDRFPARGRTVVHGRVCDVASVKPRDLRLKFEQRLERALRDLRLIRRVARQELAALDEVIDARRDVVLISAAAQEERHLACHQIPPGERPELPLDSEFARMIGQSSDRSRKPRRLGNVDEKVLDRLSSDRAEHGLPVRLGQRQITHLAELPHFYCTERGGQPGLHPAFLIEKRRRT